MSRAPPNVRVTEDVAPLKMKSPAKVSEDAAPLKTNSPAETPRPAPMKVKVKLVEAKGLEASDVAPSNLAPAEVLEALEVAPPKRPTAGRA
ncbi:Hypothetical predicted protein, partial [Paramuricea clavata]